jgi:O-antigen ligase
MKKFQRNALLIFFFSINFEVWDPLDTNGFFSLSKLTGIIFFLSICGEFKEYFRTKDVKSQLKNVWIFFGWLTLINLVNINDVSKNFFNFSIFQTLILFWILINHERKEPGIFEKGLLSFALGSIVLGILYDAGIGVSNIDGRVSLFGDNENVVGLRMCISMIILVMNIVENKLQIGKKRFLLLLPLPIMLRLMLDTGSRTAFLSFVVMFMVGLFFIKTKKWWYKIIVIILGATVAFYVGGYVVQSDIIMLRLYRSLDSGDLAGRDIIWQSLMPIIEKNYLFGIGETGYALKIGEMSPHNVFLEGLCYSGIIGLIIFTWFIIKVIRSAYLARKNVGLILPFLLLIPNLGLLLAGQLLYSKIGWVIFSYIFARANLSTGDRILPVNLVPKKS